MTFRFAHPVALLLLALPVMLLALQRVGLWQLTPSAMRYSDTRLVTGLLQAWRVRYRRIPDMMRLVVWLLLVVALARPQDGRVQEVIRGQGVEMVLALDISSSMSTQDMAGQSRLEAAKRVIADFIAGREFDRIGLVFFARDSFHQAPPTLDYEVLLRLLAEVQPALDLGLQDGTALGDAIASAANMMRANAALSRVIILVTDGASNAGALDPQTAAQAVARLGMRVYTVGTGSFAAEQELDEVTLQAIADTANGRYFRAADLPGLQQVYDQIDALERSDVEKQILVRWQERAGLLLAASLGLLVLERALRHTVYQTLP